MHRNSTKNSNILMQFIDFICDLAYNIFCIILSRQQLLWEFQSISIANIKIPDKRVAQGPTSIRTCIHNRGMPDGRGFFSSDKENRRSMAGKRPHRRRSTVVNTDSKRWVGAAALSGPLAAILKIAIGGLMMEYCSIRQISRKGGISVRWIQALCAGSVFLMLLK